MRRPVLSAGVTLTILLAISPAYAANCPVGGTTIFYGNGVNTTFVHAINSANLLQSRILSHLPAGASIDRSCLVMGLLYDPAVSQNESIGATIINIAVQASLIASVQVATEYLPQFPAWMSSPLTAPSWFAQALDIFITTSLSLQEPVVQSHLGLYMPELANDNKVIVLAHSQGNLYANEAYVRLSSPGATKYSMVGIATPADHVAGNGDYVTLINDIVTLVPRHLEANTTNNPLPGEPCSSDVNPITRLACHYLDTSYLPGVNSGPKILDAVVAAIPVPVGVKKNGNGSIISDPPGIDCGNTCIAAFPLRTGGTNTRITLTGRADPGSTFIGWTSGACLMLGTINGNSITFPVLNSPVITSFPEDCAATFDTLQAPTLLSPVEGAIITQNNPATGCPLTSGRGYGLRIDFDWTDSTSDNGIAGYELFVKKASATLPLTDVFVPSSLFTFIQCASFATDENLTGWQWRVRAEDTLGNFSAWTPDRTFQFAPCRLADGSVCSSN